MFVPKGVVPKKITNGVNVYSSTWVGAMAGGPVSKECFPWHNSCPINYICIIETGG